MNLTHHQELIEAALHGDAQRLEELIPISNPKAHASEALQLAAEGGFVECVRRLIPVSDPTAAGNNPLFGAALFGHPPVC